MNNGMSSTVIVIAAIVIAASIVVFQSLSTPSDTAEFAMYSQEVDNVYFEILTQYSDLYVQHARAGEKRTKEQIYMEIATNKDFGENASMRTTTSAAYKDQYTSLKEGTGIQNIDPDNNMLSMTLPTVRESNKAWYVTKDGDVFNANGIIYDNATYYNLWLYTNKELPASDTDQHERAEKIWRASKDNPGVSTEVSISK